MTNLKTQLEKSMALRFVTHIIGDIHQPLHAAALFDDKLFPNGDEGGNLFKIKYLPNEEIGNLHKLFDSGASNLNNSYKRVKIVIVKQKLISL